MSCILKCPNDGLKLVRSGEELQCKNGHVWEIVNSIPRFVKGADNYAASFGVQWQVWRKTQLDSYTGCVSPTNVCAVAWARNCGGNFRRLSHTTFLKPAVAQVVSRKCCLTLH